MNSKIKFKRIKTVTQQNNYFPSQNARKYLVTDEDLFTYCSR